MVMISTLRTSRLLAVGRHSLLRPKFPALTAQRNFMGVNLPVLGGVGGSHVTKYHIVKPGKENVEYDDFLIALPERDHLASMTKETPLFIRYLKVLTEKEGRAEDFDAFYERAKNGLTVESDVFISTDELTALMWKNGYSEEERTAIQSTFPSDYKFHFPEVSVLFSLPEEDTYKFCMRTRMEQSHIGELDWSKVQRKGYIRDHWIIFGTGLMIFKYFPFYGYYFGIKVFGTSMWCWTMWMLFNRWIARVSRRNEFMANQKTAADVMEGEDAIVAAMQRFSNDAKCVDDLKDFKTETEGKISEYKEAVVMKMKQELTERAQKQLQSIASFEASMGSALQELVVREAAASFRDAFPNDTGMQSSAFDSAVNALRGDSASGQDPVSKHFNSAFAGLADGHGPLAERVKAAQAQKEGEFQQSFMVTKAEAEAVAALSQQGGGSNFDPANLSGDQLKELEGLYTSINNKVGFAVPDLKLEAIDESKDAGAAGYVASVNAQLESATAALKAARLKAFTQSFA